MITSVITNHVFKKIAKKCSIPVVIYISWNLCDVKEHKYILKAWQQQAE